MGRVSVRIQCVEGATRGGIDPQAAVRLGAETGCVGAREEVEELGLVVVARVRRVRRRRTRRVDVAADRDRQDVRDALDPGLAGHRARRQADRATERVVDRVLDRDPDLIAAEQDPVDQVGRIAEVTGLVDRCGRRQGRRDAVRIVAEVGRQDRSGDDVRLGLAAPLDHRVGGRQRRGVGRVLEIAPLGVEPADIEREAGRREQDGDREGEDDEHLAALATPVRAASAVDRSRQAGEAGRAEHVRRAPADRCAPARHQLITIVTTPPRPIRPFESLGSRIEMSGITRSWW